MLTKSEKKNILLSLFASAVFLAFIQPLMKAIWSLISTVSVSFLDAYVSGFYKSAALGNRNWVDVFLLWFITALILGTASGTLLIAATQGDERPSENERITKGSVAKYRKLRRWLAWTILPLTCLAFFDLAFFAFVDLQLVATFNQRLAALAPHITIQEEREIRSRWAMMERKADYEAINQWMEESAAKAGTKLPKRLY